MKGIAMKLTQYGFIFVGDGMKANESVLDSGTFRTVVVGVSEPAEALPVAVKMVEDGIQLIELCGEFGPIWTGKVLEAIEQRVPVGSVNYGAESLLGAVQLAD